MKHYKIVKFSFCVLQKDGYKEDAKYRAYRRVLWLFWVRLKSYYSSIYDMVRHIEVEFDNEEEATNFIHSYHEHRNDVGRYKIETVKHINLN